MPTITKGRTFVSGEVVTPAKLNTLVDSATIADIVDADVSASADIVDTKLATIATAGKVANSATTATSANTANAIVARDASGNFTANTMTGNVTGTAGSLASPAIRGTSRAWVAFTAPSALASVYFLGTAGSQVVTAQKISHNLNTGDCITIFGQTGNNASLNGTWLITRVDAATFTFTITGTTYLTYNTATVYPIQIFGSYNISTVAPISTTSVGVYDVTFASGVTFPTYTTYSGSTPATVPAYWCNGSIEQPDTISWPLAARFMADSKTATKFRVKMTYISSGSSTVTGADFAGVFLSVYSL
jgi:hypothetical protein